MSNLTNYDHYLADEGPAALVIREHLIPVEGADGVIFPATYASGDGFAGGYNIDGDANGTNICLIDSVGSQANRIEPLFKEEKYRHLVPQVVVKAGDKEISIFDAGHRAGDAIVRCTELEAKINEAFKAVLKGDAEPLARIAPTSLIFGVWDSRDTQAKMPRLVASTIRAFNVRKLTRSAQYVPAVEYVTAKLLDEPTDKKTKETYAERGFIHVPATATHGGIIATEGIRRDATLSLTALRLLAANSKEKNLALRRYILGLALTAFTFQPTGYLRQGCLLVLDPKKPRCFDEVFSDGRRIAARLTHRQALEFATDAAAEFIVSQQSLVSFDPKLAKKDLERAKKTKKTE